MESLGPTIKIGGRLVIEDILIDVLAFVPPPAELGHTGYRHLKYLDVPKPCNGW